MKAYVLIECDERYGEDRTVGVSTDSEIAERWRIERPCWRTVLTVPMLDAMGPADRYARAKAAAAQAQGIAADAKAIATELHGEESVSTPDAVSDKAVEDQWLMESMRFAVSGLNGEFPPSIAFWVRRGSAALRVIAAQDAQIKTLRDELAEGKSHSLRNVSTLRMVFL